MLDGVDKVVQSAESPLTVRAAHMGIVITNHVDHGRARFSAKTWRDFAKLRTYTLQPARAWAMNGSLRRLWE